MNIVIYLVAAAIGLVLSSMAIVFALLGGLAFAYLIGGLLAAAHIGSFVYVRRMAVQGKGRQAAIALALPLPLVMAVVWVFQIGYAIFFS